MARRRWITSAALASPATTPTPDQPAARHSRGREPPVRTRHPADRDHRRRIRAGHPRPHDVRRDTPGLGRERARRDRAVHTPKIHDVVKLLNSLARAARGDEAQLVREMSASPRSFAAMTRDRTATIIELLRTIQSRNPINTSLPRRRISTWIARGTPGPAAPSTTNTATPAACPAALVPISATATPAPIDSSRFFGLTTLNSTARPAAFAGAIFSSLRIQTGVVSPSPR